MKNRNTTEGLHHHNRSLVLHSLRRLGPSSHTNIAEDSALASGTVSVITAELFEEGAILKSEQPTSKGRGRPRVLLTLHPDFARLAFVHIASGEVEYSLINYFNVLLDQFKVPRHLVETHAPAFGAQVRRDLFRLAERVKPAPVRDCKYFHYDKRTGRWWWHQTLMVSRFWRQSNRFCHAFKTGMAG